MSHKIRCINSDCSGKMIRVYTGALSFTDPPMKPWIWLCPICESKRHGGWDRELTGASLSILERRIKAINPRYELADPQETIASSYTGYEQFDETSHSNSAERDSSDRRRITRTVAVIATVEG